MLSVRNLAYRYPHAPQPALNRVSFEVARGEVLGLLGPNGAGKTTLISHLSGLLPLQSGDIHINGQALVVARAAKPTRLSLAPQSYAFYPMLSVSENLACFAAAGGLARNNKRARIAECIAHAQLQRFSKVRAERLSGGLKRRLNLAIALLHEPELLLLDEPTAGVDPQSRAFLLMTVKQLAQSGCAVIYTSHYMEEVEAIADRVMILDQGQVLRYAPMAQLLADSGTQLQLAVDGIADDALATLLAPFGQSTRLGDSVQLALNSSCTPTAVLAAVEAAGFTIRHAKFGRYNLEQLFMTLTQRSLRD